MSALVLKQVIYELFEFEALVLSEQNSHIAHTIDREVRLVFSTGESLFVSWCSEPVQYAIGIQNRSFFKATTAIAIDASSHPMWSGLIDQPIQLTAMDDSNQIFEVRGLTSTIYFSACEDGYWQADVVTISSVKPSDVT